MARELGDLHGLALGFLGLGGIYFVHKEYTQAQQAYKDSISLYHQARQEDELSLTLADLSDVEYHLRLTSQARTHLREALQISVETGSWQASLHALGRTALFLARQGDVEKGVEIYALVTRYPYLGKSCYWRETAGNEMSE